MAGETRVSVCLCIALHSRLKSSPARQLLWRDHWDYSPRTSAIAQPHTLLPSVLWQVYAAIAVAAWAASAAFHARDVKLTERTDYLLADALVLFGLLVAAARALGWGGRHSAALTPVTCPSLSR